MCAFKNNLSGVYRGRLKMSLSSLIAMSLTFGFFLWPNLNHRFTSYGYKEIWVTVFPERLERPRSDRIDTLTEWFGAGWPLAWWEIEITPNAKEEYFNYYSLMVNLIVGVGATGTVGCLVNLLSAKGMACSGKTKPS